MKSLEISISLVVQVAVDNEKYIFNIDILINCCRFRNISEYVEDYFSVANSSRLTVKKKSS